MGTGTLTATGYDPKRLADVKADLEAAFRVQFGNDIDLGADTPEGKIIGVLAAEISELWEVSEDVFGAAYPATASGVALDAIAQITGASRNPATKSAGTAFVRGSAVTVPAGTIFETSGAGNKFETTEGVTIPAETILSDVAVGAGNDLTQTAGTATLTYGTGHGKSPGEFIWLDGCDQDEYNGVKEILTTPTSTTLTFAVDSGATSPATGTVNAYEAFPVAVRAISTGVVPALAGTLTVIVSSVSGLDAVTNLEDVTTGSDEETDVEFRARRIAALQGLGNSALDAIRGDLLNVTNVTFAKVFENNTDATVSGRPPHSIECVVLGGTDAAVAQAILDSKGAGIATYGSSSASATDGQGTSHTVYFSRPAEIDIYLDITLTVNADYPSDGDAQVETAVLAWAEDNLSIGDDVVVFPYLLGAFDGIDGITDVTIDIGTSASPSGDANIAIAETEIAVFDSGRTTVSS